MADLPSREQLRSDRMEVWSGIEFIRAQLAEFTKEHEHDIYVPTSRVQVVVDTCNELLDAYEDLCLHANRLIDRIFVHREEKDNG